VIRRAIDKWLNAGVLEDGRVERPASGTPQGGVISPILANIYLHEVLDTWFEEVAKPRLRGEAYLIRFADDAVLVFTEDRDAEMMMRVLPQRFAKYGLTLHPEKTREVAFRRPPRRTGGRGPSRTDRPDTFDLLGFTHYWAVSRKGNWVVKRKTACGRMKRGLRAVTLWCQRHRHMKVADQHKRLSSLLRGHFNYYGITCNSQAIKTFRTQVIRTWRKWLDRRSQRGRMTWPRFQRLLERYPLPPAHAVHSACRP